MGKVRSAEWLSNAYTAKIRRSGLEGRKGAGVHCNVDSLAAVICSTNPLSSLAPPGMTARWPRDDTTPKNPYIVQHPLRRRDPFNRRLPAMARFRARRIVGPIVRLVLVLVAVFFAARYLVLTILAEGISPAAVFGILVFVAAVALTWRAVLDMRKAMRKLRT